MKGKVGGRNKRQIHDEVRLLKRKERQDRQETKQEEEVERKRRKK